MVKESEDALIANGVFQNNLAPWLALIATQFLFGGLPAFSKLALAEASPLALVLLRSAAAALFLGLVLALRTLKKTRSAVHRGMWLSGMRWLVGAHLGVGLWLQIFGLAFVGISLNQGILFLGLTKTTSAAAAILSPNIALMTLCFSLVLGKEKFALSKLANIALGFAGIFLLFWPQLHASLQTGQIEEKQVLIGNLLCVASTTVYALYMVLSTGVIAKVGALEFSFRVFFAASFFNVLLYYGFEHSWPWEAFRFSFLAEFSGGFWLAIVYVVFGATIATYLLNAFALKRIVPGIVGGFVCLQPVIGVLISKTLIKETIPLSYFFGMALVVGGVLLLWWSNLRSMRSLAE